MIVDIRWRILGESRIPLQHQYPLLSAVSKLVPAVHDRNLLGIHPIRGMHTEPGYLRTTDDSAVTIRAPADQIPIFLVLSGTRLDIGGCFIRLGVPQIFSLKPWRRLTSYLVTIKGYMERDVFEIAARRQLEEVGISPNAIVNIGARRILRIKDKTIVGYQVDVDGLAPMESLSLQHQGVGGRRHMGCGLFNAGPQAECRQEG